MSDRIFRWLYEQAPVLRTEIRSLIRHSIGTREIAYRGLRWKCHPKDNSVERSLWLHQATEEEREIDWLLSRLRPGDYFCDIGANCGVYALPVRAATGAKVVAIEPNPTMQNRLAENVAINSLDGISIIAAAVGEASGRMNLAMGSRWDYGQASLLKRPGSLSIEVTVRTLADILKECGVLRFAAVKIDVEGYEDKALGKYLAECGDCELPSSIVVEHLHSNTWSRDLYALAISRGYTLAEKTKNNFLFEL